MCDRVLSCCDFSYRVYHDSQLPLCRDLIVPVNYGPSSAIIILFIMSSRHISTSVMQPSLYYIEITNSGENWGKGLVHSK